MSSNVETELKAELETAKAELEASKKECAELKVELDAAWNPSDCPGCTLSVGQYQEQECEVCLKRRVNTCDCHDRYNHICCFWCDDGDLPMYLLMRD